MARIRYPECGKIVNTHGYHGAVKIEHWCDSAEVLAGLSTVYYRQNGALVPLQVTDTAVFGTKFVFAELAGVDTIREVIPFPMNKRAQDIMMGAPGYVTDAQLRDVHIRVVDTDKE